MKEYIEQNKKGLLLVLIGFSLLVMMVTINIMGSQKELQVSKLKYQASINVTEPETLRELTESEILEHFIADKENVISFFASVFQIDKDILTNRLRDNYKELGLLDQNNFDYFMIEYLFDLERNDKGLFNKTVVPCKDSKEYIVSLIKYFTDIYQEVDFTIAASIAQIESNYVAMGMLNRNNIFGGMSNGGLIRYKNIEYGVLSYIKLLNDGYFTKGLTTVETIGKVYNPTFNENGEKIAKPTWVYNVNNAKLEFEEFASVDINTLNSLKNNSNY